MVGAKSAARAREKQSSEQTGFYFIVTDVAKS